MNKKCRNIVTIFLLSCIVIFLATLSGCKRKDKEMASLKVNFIPVIGWGPLYFAKDEGFFKEQGLAIDFIKLGVSAKAMPALVHGDLDVFAGISTAGFFNAIAKGQTIKVVADNGHNEVGRPAMSVLMVRKDLWDSKAIARIEDLKGRKIGLSSAGGLSDYGMSKVLKRANMTLEDIQIVRGGFPLFVEALQNNNLDAGFLSEPFITMAKDLECVVEMIPQPEIIPDDQRGVIIFGPNLLEKNRGLGKKFMIAYLKGVRQYNEGKTDRNIEIIHKYTAIDKEILERCEWTAIHPDGHLNVESLLAFQGWLHENGFVDTKVEAEQLVDTSFVEYASEVLQSSR